MLHNRNTSTMNAKLFKDKLLTVILVLAGLYILKIILPFATTFLPRDISLMISTYWASHAIFGLTMLWLTRNNGTIALQVSILSTLLPAYGAIFYLLSTVQKQEKQWTTDILDL